jgi:hypothetical protein
MVSENRECGSSALLECSALGFEWVTCGMEENHQSGKRQHVRYMIEITFFSEVQKAVSL